MKHNAVTGLTAQDVIKEACIMRILGIIALYAIISENLPRLIEDFSRYDAFMQAWV